MPARPPVDAPYREVADDRPPAGSAPRPCRSAPGGVCEKTHGLFTGRPEWPRRRRCLPPGIRRRLVHLADAASDHPRGPRHDNQLAHGCADRRAESMAPRSSAMRRRVRRGRFRPSIRAVATTTPPATTTGISAPTRSSPTSTPRASTSPVSTPRTARPSSGSRSMVHLKSDTLTATPGHRE